jgi:O-phospho-L-seryl-tRNASec:L-selenocysteinyl-tRNA synthase
MLSGVLSTTSCFAPRQPDAIDEIAKLCKEFNVAHVINNAYGLQCPLITKLINRAVVVGHVDAGRYHHNNLIYFLPTFSYS